MMHGAYNVKFNEFTFQNDGEGYLSFSMWIKFHVSSLEDSKVYLMKSLTDKTFSACKKRKRNLIKCLFRLKIRKLHLFISLSSQTFIPG